MVRIDPSHVGVLSSSVSGISRAFEKRMSRAGNRLLDLGQGHKEIATKLKYGRGPLSASAEDAGLNDKREGTGRYA